MYVLQVFWLFDPFDRLGGKKNVITARYILTIITILRLSIYILYNLELILSLQSLERFGERYLVFISEDGTNTILKTNGL